MHQKTVIYTDRLWHTLVNRVIHWQTVLDICRRYINSQTNRQAATEPLHAEIKAKCTMSGGLISRLDINSLPQFQSIRIQWSTGTHEAIGTNCLLCLVHHFSPVNGIHHVSWTRHLFSGCNLAQDLSTSMDSLLTKSILLKKGTMMTASANASKTYSVNQSNVRLFYPRQADLT